MYVEITEKKKEKKSQNWRTKKKNSQWCSIRDPIVLINNKIPGIPIE